MINYENIFKGISLLLSTESCVFLISLTANLLRKGLIENPRNVWIWVHYIPKTLSAWSTGATVAAQRKLFQKSR